MRLDIVPFADDELLLGLSHGPDDCITVLAWVFEADQGSADFIVQILVAGRELVSEQMQQGEIDFIGTVRIGVAIATGQLWNGFHNRPLAVGTPRPNLDSGETRSVAIHSLQIQAPAA
jgi:hypothetical protein